jgi:hypothetical protein
MVKVEIYEPVHECCGGGGNCGCGGDDNQAKMMVKAAFHALKDVDSIEAVRHQIDLETFNENETVVKAIAGDEENLPVTVLDGKVVKMGTYPSLDELSDYTGLGFVMEEPGEGGCCGGSGCCC